MAHPSVRWQDESLSVATHKPQVYIDLSGWSPKYFPPQRVQYANALLMHMVLFGTDYPLLAPDRWIADFATRDIKPEVQPLIMKENAVRLLGLKRSRAARSASKQSCPRDRSTRFSTSASLRRCHDFVMRRVGAQLSQ